MGRMNIFMSLSLFSSLIFVEQNHSVWKFQRYYYLSEKSVGIWYYLIHKIVNYNPCQFLQLGGQEILWEVTA